MLLRGGFAELVRKRCDLPCPASLWSPSASHAGLALPERRLSQHQPSAKVDYSFLKPRHVVILISRCAVVGARGGIVTVTYFVDVSAFVDFR
jgi:hypothetical protein